MSETVAPLLSSWQARDLYVERKLALGMQRKDFARHVDNIFEPPHRKELKQKLMMAWFKVTGEKSKTQRWRLPKENSQMFDKLLTEGWARDKYAKRFKRLNMSNEDFVEHINDVFPLTHHDELRDRLLFSWNSVTVPPALAESARHTSEDASGPLASPSKSDSKAATLCSSVSGA